MPQYNYMLYLFLVNVFDASSQSSNKPAWLWKQETGASVIKFRDTVVFDDRDQMFVAIQNTGLLSPTQFADADRAFREYGFSSSIVCVPFGKEAAVNPNLSPEPDCVTPSEDFKLKVEALNKG